MKELNFMLNFAKTQDLYFNTTCMQLRSLFTAYCLHNDIEADTTLYDNVIDNLYRKLQQNPTNPWKDNEDFGIIGLELLNNYLTEEMI